MLETKGIIYGRQTAKPIEGPKRHYTYLKLPRVWPNKILTMVGEGEDWLPYGTRGASAILVKVDPRSLRHDGVGFTADVEVVDVWQEEGPTGDDSGGPQEDEGGSS